MTSFIKSNSTVYNFDNNQCIESTITVSESFVINKVVVVIDDIVCTWMSEVTIDLIAPDNTIVKLAYERGGSNNGYINTVFNSCATISIVNWQQLLKLHPLLYYVISGICKPEGDLDVLNGKNSNGVWKLKVCDISGGDPTFVNKWTLRLNADPLLSETIINNSSCSLPNGKITVNASGGLAPYTYLWGNGSTGDYIENLPAGKYTVTVTDSLKCKANGSYDVIDNKIAVTGTVTDVTCFEGDNGAIVIDVSGGTPNYTYLWSNGANTKDINGLIAGTYSVTVTDDNDCSITYSRVVSQPPYAVPIININPMTIVLGSCITYTFSGTASSYQYYITYPNGSVSQTMTGDSYEFKPLQVGKYVLTVIGTNNDDCYNSSTLDIFVKPPLLKISAGKNKKICYRQCITLKGKSCSKNIKYKWNKGVIDGVPFAPPIGTTVYTVTGTDIYGNKAKDTVTITTVNCCCCK